MKANFTFFEFIDQRLELWYRHYGKTVARHPWLLIFVPILATAISAVGLPYRNVVTDFIELNVPTDARYYGEKAIVDHHWPDIDGYYNPNKATNSKYLFQIIVRPKTKGANILEPKYAKEVEEINEWVANEIYIFHKGQRIQYYNLCYYTFDMNCYHNQLIIYLNWKFVTEPELFTFPTYQGVFELIKLNIAGTLGNVSLVEEDGEATNKIAKAEAYMLNYHLNINAFIAGVQDQQETEEILEKFLAEFERSMTAYNTTENDIYLHRWESYVEDFKSTSALLRKDFVTAFIIIFIFSSFAGTIFLTKPQGATGWRWWHNLLVDWVRSKSALGLLSCVTSGMGTITAIGLLAAFRCKWLTSVSVLPFLILAIGVDNMFLLAAAWKRHGDAPSVEDRMGETLADAAVSITITALTDFLSFAIACITTIPAVQAFCIHASVAILMTFIYQLTFFTGCMVLAGRLEHGGRHHLAGYRATPVQVLDSASICDKLFSMGVTARKSSELPLKTTHLDESSHAEFQFFRNWYGPQLAKIHVKIYVVILYFGYLAASTYGCTQTKLGLDTMGLFNKQTPLYKFQQLWRSSFHDKGLTMQVIVNNPPNFTDPRSAVAVSNEIVESFLNTPFTYDRKGLIYVFDDYNTFLSDSALWNYIDEYDQKLFRVNLKDAYLKGIPNNRYGIDVKFGDSVDNGYDIQAFRFELILRNTQTSLQKKEACDLMRAIADSWPQYNVTVYSQFWLYADNFRVALPNTLQNMAIAIGAMLIVAIFFIPHILAAFLVGLSIVSIAVGVVGFMSLWGVHLDSVSMITLTMSIGFSVDFTAHFCHGFVTCRHVTDPNERISVVLGKLGVPIIQGAASTILGVLVLAFIDIYMIQVFFANVFLVIVIGSVHSLLFLPVALSLLMGGF